MKSELIAIPVFEERISPLLDVAGRFVIFEVDEKRVTQRIVIKINQETDRLRIMKLKELGVTVIISGAVSRYLSHIIQGAGLKLIPWINGQVDEVILLYLDNSMQSIPPANGSCGGMMRKRKLVADLPVKGSAENDKKEIL